MEVGQGRHVPFRNCHAEIFPLNSMEFVTFSQIFSIISDFSGFVPDPAWGSVPPLVTEPAPLSPPKQIPNYTPLSTS